MAAKPIVLLVGASGMLGKLIADAILEKGANDLRVLVRDASSATEKLKDLKTRGVGFYEGDIMKPETLPAAVAGVEAVISAIGNDPAEVFVAGQRNLLEAAEKAGVKKFMPSDFSGDYHSLDYGENVNNDLRKEFFEILRQSKVPYAAVNNGCFMEVLFTFVRTFDLENKTFNYWGEGDEPCDFTSYADVALYTAEVAADEDFTNATLEVAGEVTGFKGLLASYEAVTGEKLSENRFGSVDELKQTIERTKAVAKSPYEYLANQYLWGMLSGKTKLKNLGNHRYPQVKPKNFREFVAAMR